MDENYWKAVAESWIKSRQQNEIPQAPNISFDDHFHARPIASDNLIVADMELEDDVKEEPVHTAHPAAWNNSHQNHFPAVIQNLHQQQHQDLSSSHFSKHQHHGHRKTFSGSDILLAPPAPNITFTEDQLKKFSEEQLHSIIDMEMDDSDNDDSNSNSASSSMADHHKKKTLPIWIREGLEKMKREKEQESSRFQEELKRKEEEERRKEMMEEALKEIEREKLSKSKYVSSNF